MDEGVFNELTEPNQTKLTVCTIEPPAAANNLNIERTNHRNIQPISFQPLQSAPNEPIVPRVFHPMNGSYIEGMKHEPFSRHIGRSIVSTMDDTMLKDDDDMMMRMMVRWMM